MPDPATFPSAGNLAPRQLKRSTAGPDRFDRPILLATFSSPLASDGSRIFLELGNLTDIVRPVSLTGIIALGMTLVILTGGIDLYAFHIRIILERLQKYGVPIHRVINAGGIPQRSEILNRVYASVLNKPILVPAASATSIGAAIFALLAIGAFQSVEAAQQALSPTLRSVEPVAHDVQVYEALHARFRELYFTLSEPEWLRRLAPA
jgi:L-ribulokinase